MKSLISIIMPVFNVEKFVGNAISSVKKQTYSHWELLIVNDGSNDKTEDIINRFEDSKIRYFKQDNQGVSAARNIGLQNMTGDFFCFLDADDILTPNSLLSRLDIFQQDANIDFVDGSVDYFNADFSRKIKTWNPDFKGNPLEDLLKLSGKCFFGNTWMVKRKPQVIYEFKDGLTHGEDLLFYINLARQGGLYGYTNETILCYRTGHQSSMKNLNGLERGYFQIYYEIKKKSDLSNQLVQTYYKRARSIVWKNYLRRFQFFHVIRSLLEKWKV